MVTSADINGVPVEDGQVVRLFTKDWDDQKVFTNPATLPVRIFARDFVLTVTCTDAAGNETVVTTEPQFRPPNS